MRSVEVKFLSSLDDPKTEPFTVALEALNGDRWDLKARNPDVYAGPDGTKTYTLEAGERLIIEPMNAAPRMVFDKEQNANVRVETEAEIKERAEREAKSAANEADRKLEAAQGKSDEARAAAEKAQAEADKEVKRTEAEKAKILADQTRKEAAAAEQKAAGTPVQPQANTGTTGTSSKPTMPGNPASANTGPIDSKQIKIEGNMTTSTPTDKK